jgi:hypothetical protein
MRYKFDPKKMMHLVVVGSDGLATRQGTLGSQEMEMPEQSEVWLNHERQIRTAAKG